MGAPLLINTLALQEAKDSSAIENIVTTHDELFRDAAFPDAAASPAAKEVARYRQALGTGFEAVAQSGLLTTAHILTIQDVLEASKPGFRRLPGTVLRATTGETVYTPPSPDQIAGLMGDLDHVVNDECVFAADPLIKMALIHHQFESIHPPPCISAATSSGRSPTTRISIFVYGCMSAILMCRG